MNLLFDYEYDEMLRIFNQNGLITENLFFKNNKYHPITYGELDHKTGYFEKVLTHKDDLGSSQSLDYIFAVKLNKNVGSNYYYERRDYSGSSIDNTEHQGVENGMTFGEEKIEIKDEKDVENTEKSVMDLEKKVKNSILKVDFDDMLDCANVNDVSKALHVLPNSVSVIKHLVSEMNFNDHERIYTQLSDHYGVSCLINHIGGMKRETVLIVEETNENVPEKKEKEVKEEVEIDNVIEESRLLVH